MKKFRFSVDYMIAPPKEVQAEHWAFDPELQRVSFYKNKEGEGAPFASYGVGRLWSIEEAEE